MSDISFFTVDGLDVPIATTGGSEDAPTTVGERARALDGTLLSAVSGEGTAPQLTTTPPAAGFDANSGTITIQPVARDRFYGLIRPALA